MEACHLANQNEIKAKGQGLLKICELLIFISLLFRIVYENFFMNVIGHNKPIQFSPFFNIVRELLQLL